ncbi:unnamed protein product [Lymnaea stagnalis]|uniref:Uncharacterized protein n=1 Tax=Lymnaea stagnalis TaxID=6523 RepID=A0AAV2HNU2_LYMST
MLEEHLTRKTSTPTHDKSVFPHDIDASAIQSVSTMSINMSTVGGDGSHSDNRAEFDSGKKPAAKSSSSSRVNVANTASTPLAKSLELDMAYTKYLQWVFLNGKAKQFYEDEEALATAQIHGLWKLLESKREEGAALDLDVDMLKKYNRLDEVLEKTESELESLTAVLPQLEEDYSHLSAALDTTRHQIPVEDIFLPQDGVERDIYEEKLENALKESEQLLAEISTITGVKLEPLQHYQNYMEAIDANLSSTNDEIGACEVDLDVVQGLTTRLTSLIVQDMQSK